MNSRAAGRARSYREFTAKLGTVAEEADECAGWLDFVARLELATGSELSALVEESRELTAIFGSAYRTAKEKRRTPTQLSSGRQSPKPV